jgi:hypothetical protein
LEVPLHQVHSLIRIRHNKIFEMFIHIFSEIIKDVIGVQSRESGDGVKFPIVIAIKRMKREIDQMRLISANKTRDSTRTSIFKRRISYVCAKRNRHSQFSVDSCQLPPNDNGKYRY